MNKYYVGSNYCNCHPETCCCNDYAVYYPNGDKYLSFKREKDAETFAEILNLKDQVSGMLREDK